MRLARWLAVLFAVATVTRSASATIIVYEAVDLPDTITGEDLWQYQYRASDFTFDAGFGFSIFFDYAKYSALETTPTSPNADWDVLTLQPDENLPDDGIYDALSLANPAALSDSFAVSFVWLGSGSPGSQPFVIYEPAFATVETGLTVPEPTTAILLALGILFLVASPTVDKRR